MFDYSHSLEIGKLTAESETSTFIHDHFVDIPTDSILRSRGSHIILGRKGSGKSALKKHFNSFHNTNCEVVGFAPNGFEFNSLMEYVTSPDQPNVSTSLAQKIWQISFLLSVCACVFSKSNRNRLPVQSISPLVRDYIKSVQIKENEVSFESTIACLQKNQIKPAQLSDFCLKLDVSIEKILVDMDLDVFFVVDSIDDVLYGEFDITRRDNYFSIYFESLILFFKEFANRKICSKVDCINLKVFLPSDAFKLSVNRHHDHIKGHVRELKWQRNDMETFILKRLSSNLSNASNLDNDAIWREFLPWEYEHQIFLPDGRTDYKRKITRDMLIEMTLRRPRDLVDLLSHISIQTQADHELNFPNAHILDLAFRQYSQSLRESVEKEYEKVLPEIRRILGCFSENYSRISKDVLRQIILSAGIDQSKVENVLEVLFDANILGGVVEQPGPIFTKKIDTRYKYDQPNFYSFWNSQKFDIHPGFHKSLGVYPVS